MADKLAPMKAGSLDKPQAVLLERRKAEYLVAKLVEWKVVCLVDLMASDSVAEMVELLAALLVS